jgi:hypothetical protein
MVELSVLIGAYNMHTRVMSALRIQFRRIIPMTKPFHIVIEDDVFTRVLDVVLNPECSSERKMAFADFFAHDIAHFSTGPKGPEIERHNLQNCSVQFVHSEKSWAQLPHAHAVIVESFRDRVRRN